MAAFRIYRRLRELLDVNLSGVADGDALVYDEGTESFVPGAGGGGGVSDHGALTGLADDDHAQYHTDARGDARYQPVDSDLTALAALSTTAFGRGLLILANQAALLSAAGAAAAAHAHAGEDVTSGTIADARIASTIARDSEVTAAIDAAIANLLDSAPGALDTLNELAAALGDDPAFATTVTNALAGKQPLDSDLTAIAALATTAFGRSLLALADQAALLAAAGAAAASHAHAGEDITSGTVADARIAATIARDSEVTTAANAAQTAAEATAAAALSAHLSDGTDAHDASAVSIADAANDFTATEVEGALAELQAADETDEAALAAHLADSSDAHDASAVSFSPTGTIAATDVQAAIAEVASEAGSASTDGWTDDSANTWTYASAATFTVAGDRTAVFQKGTRLRFTQTTVKYGVVAASSHAAGTTTVTIAVNTDYVLANAAISVNSYSYQDCPRGYPGWFTFAPAVSGWAATPTLNHARFAVVGNVCHVSISVTGTSNAITVSFTGPITAARVNAILGHAYGQNNGVALSPGPVFNNSGVNATVQVYSGPALGAWSGGGVKTVIGTYCYEI